MKTKSFEYHVNIANNSGAFAPESPSRSAAYEAEGKNRLVSNGVKSINFNC